MRLSQFVLGFSAVTTVFLPSLTTARLWSWSFSTDPPFLFDQNSKDLMSTSEVNALFLNMQNLDAYSQKPDCFRNAVVAIRNRCGEAEMTEVERIRAAIFMTLCEIATAKHHLSPLECASFSSQAREEVIDDEESQSLCVGALSRSPQFWSSYSGYLREVPQLCFAYRRWHDIDTSKSIYLNATLEKLALVRLLKEREMRLATFMDDWADNLSLRTSSGDLQAQVFSSNEQFGKLVVNMGSTVSEFEKNLHEFFVSAQQEHQTQLDWHASQFPLLLQPVVENHTESLLQVVSTIEHSLFSRIQSIHDVAVGRAENLLLSLSQVDGYWKRMGHQMTNLTRTASGIAHIMDRTAVQVELNIGQIFAQQRFQAEAFDAMQNLTRSVALLSSVAHTEIRHLNETARELRVQLLPHLYLPSVWLKHCAKFLIGVNPVFLGHLYRLPLLHFLFQFLSVSWSLLQLLCSLVMGVFVVRHSSSRLRAGNTESRHLESRPRISSRVAGYTSVGYPIIQPHGFRMSRIPARLYMPASSIG